MVELLREWVTVVNSKNAFEDVQVDGYVEVLPGVVICEFPDYSGDLLALQEYALRDAGVFYFFFCDEEGLVRKIVVDEYWSDSIVF